MQNLIVELYGKKLVHLSVSEQVSEGRRDKHIKDIRLKGHFLTLCKTSISMQSGLKN